MAEFIMMTDFTSKEMNRLFYRDLQYTESISEKLPSNEQLIINRNLNDPLIPK